MLSSSGNNTFPALKSVIWAAPHGGGGGQFPPYMLLLLRFFCCQVRGQLIMIIPPYPFMKSFSITFLGWKKCIGIPPPPPAEQLFQGWWRNIKAFRHPIAKHPGAAPAVCGHNGIVWILPSCQIGLHNQSQLGKEKKNTNNNDHIDTISSF